MSLEETQEILLEAARSTGQEMTLGDRINWGDPLGAGKKLVSLFQAVTGGQYVSPERQEVRMLICSGCPRLGLHECSPVCTECGCRLSGDRGITNLILYEETDKYGCKFQDEDGRVYSKWKMAGV